MAVKIVPLDNGPLMVEGEIETRLTHWSADRHEGKQIVPRRCGGSTRKLPCDGTHSRIGFAAAEAAVAKQDAEA